MNDIVRKYDDYSFDTGSQAELIEEVKLMEENSEWKDEVISKDMLLEAIEAPLYAADAAARYGLDPELMQDTANGTKLLLDYCGEKMMVRDTAKQTLGETAKLYGSALGRMSPPLMAETYNNGLSVARGKSLLLMRYGKLSALHSDSEGGYQIMPISSLLDISTSKLGHDFGEIDFKEGYNTHGYTSALWTLPEAQDDILTIYQDALRNAVSHNFSISMMPAVRLMTSDTANSCARLIPVFIMRGNEYRLTDGISIKHAKNVVRDGKRGLDAFETAAGELYAQFRSCSEVIARLGQIRINNGCNCIVSLCKRYDIPKKYGEAARIFAERMTQNGRYVSAHDIYLCMTEAVAEAKQLGASWTQILNLQESIAKITNADWPSHDVGGTVAWN